MSLDHRLKAIERRIPDDCEHCRNRSHNGLPGYDRFTPEARSALADAHRRVRDTPHRKRCHHCGRDLGGSTLRVLTAEEDAIYEEELYRLAPPTPFGVHGNGTFPNCACSTCRWYRRHQQLNNR
jgi:hypothetical protein